MFKTSPGSHPERAPAITPSLSLFYSHEYTKVTCQKGPLCLSLILFFFPTKVVVNPSPIIILSFFSFSLLLIPTRGTPHYFLLFPTFSHAPPDYLTLTYLLSPHITIFLSSFLSFLFFYSTRQVWEENSHRTWLLPHACNDWEAWMVGPTRPRSRSTTTLKVAQGPSTWCVVRISKGGPPGTHSFQKRKNSMLGFGF